MNPTAEVNGASVRKPSRARLLSFILLIILFGRSQCAFAAAPTSVSLSVTPNPSVYGSPVALSALVSPADATGKVTFYNGVTTLGIATLSGGSATLSTILLPAGVQSLQARYSGDSTYSASVSAPVSQAVNEVAATGFALAPGSPFATDGTSTCGPFTCRGYSGTPVVADFNGDGKPDVANMNYDFRDGFSGNDTLTVLLGDGKGGFSVGTPIPIGGSCYDSHYFSFSFITSEPQGCKIITGDFNGDGKTDLVFAYASDLSGCPAASCAISLWLGDGKGGFTPAAHSPFRVPLRGQLAAADFNGDGNLDLAFVATDPATSQAGLYVWLGDGAGDFPTKLGPFGVGRLPNYFNSFYLIEALDFNGDGNADLVVGGSVSLILLLGDGSGALTPANGQLFPDSNFQTDLVVADFNRDGKSDIAISSGSVLAIALGNAAASTSTTFSINLPQDGFLASADLNGDGKPDLLLRSFGADLIGSPNVAPYLYLLAGDGNGGFASPVQLSAVSLAPAYMAVADFNGDGRADLAISTSQFSGCCEAVPYAAMQVLLGANVQPPASIAAFSGTPQSASVGSTFATPLQAVVKDSNGTPLSLVAVNLSAPDPSNSAGGEFFAYTVAVTDANGVATAPPFSANFFAGSYTATATVSGVEGQADFMLTNLPLDISNGVSVTSNGFIYSRVSNTYSGNILLTTKGSFNGPVAVVLSGLPPGVTLLNASGIYNGAPYIAASFNVPLPLRFSGPPGITITFTPVTYIGF